MFYLFYFFLLNARILYYYIRCVCEMDSVHQSIAAMSLLPPHCPMNPRGFASFFNDSSQLPGGVAPYKLETAKHPRDGHLVQKLEYNNFYTDWKQDALKWSPRDTKELESSGKGKLNQLLPRDKALNLYEATKRHDRFAVPLPTNGTNQVRILFNDKCNVPTFQYKRYAATPVNNSAWFYNKLYIEDITEETQELKAQYMDSIVQNSMVLYSSVFEDMYLMQLNPSSGGGESDKLGYIRKTY